MRRKPAIATRATSPRAADPHDLAAILRSHDVRTHIAPDPVSALALARSQAQSTDLICVTGSLLLLGELKARLQGLPLEM